MMTLSVPSLGKEDRSRASELETVTDATAAAAVIFAVTSPTAAGTCGWATALLSPSPGTEHGSTVSELVTDADAQEADHTATAIVPEVKAVPHTRPDFVLVQSQPPPPPPPPAPVLQITLPLPSPGTEDRSRASELVSQAPPLTPLPPPPPFADADAVMQ